MALTFTTGMTQAAEGDVGTETWAAYRITGTGGAPSAVAADANIEGANAVQAKLAGNSWDSGLIYDYYTDNSNTVLDLSASGSEVIALWAQYLLPAKALTRSAGGMYILVQSSAETGTSAPTKYAKWYISGSDVYPGGWVLFMIDTRKTPSTTAGGWAAGTDLALTRRIAFGVVNIASVGSIKGEPGYCDAIWYGRPNYKLVGDGATTADWDDFITHSITTQANGLIEDVGGAYKLSCGIQFGDTAQASTTTFLDATGKQFIFKRHTYYQAGVVDALNYGDYYIVQGDGKVAGAVKTSITLGSVVGTGDNRQGLLGGGLRTEDATNVTWSMDFQTNKAVLSAVKLYGVDMIGGKGGIILDNDSGGTETSVISCLLSSCGEVDPGSTGNGAEILSCAVIDPLGGGNNYGLKMPSVHNIKGISFITSGTPTTQHMLNLITSGAYSLTLDAIKMFGNFASGTLWHGDMSNATLTTVTGVPSNGQTADDTEFAKTGNASSTITIPTGVTITFTGMKDNTEVRVYKTSDGTEVAGVENATSGSPGDRSFAWTAAAALNVFYVIHNVDYETIRVNGYVVPSSAASIPIQQRLDRNYSNP